MLVFGKLVIWWIMFFRCWRDGSMRGNKCLLKVVIVVDFFFVLLEIVMLGVCFLVFLLVVLFVFNFWWICWIFLLVLILIFKSLLLGIKWENVIIGVLFFMFVMNNILEFVLCIILRKCFCGSWGCLLIWFWKNVVNVVWCCFL